MQKDSNRKLLQHVILIKLINLNSDGKKKKIAFLQRTISILFSRRILPETGQIRYLWCNELAVRQFQVRILSIGFPAREQRCPIIYDHTALRFNDFRKDGQESCNLSSCASWILMFGELYAFYHRQLWKYR